MLPLLLGAVFVASLAKDRTRVKRDRGFFSKTTTIERRPGLFSSATPSKTVHHDGFFSRYTEVSGSCHACGGSGTFRTGSTCRKCGGSGRYVRRYPR